MTRKAPSVASFRLSRTELAAVDSLAHARGFRSRNDLLRSAVIALAKSRGATPDAAVAAKLPAAARERYLRARRARHLETARRSSRASDVIDAVASALALPGGASSDDLAEAVGALRGDAALAVLGEVLRALGVRVPATPEGK